MMDRLLGEPIDWPGLPDDVVARRSGLVARIARGFLGTGQPPAAVTLGNTIFVHPETRLTARLLRHELAHVRQWRHRPLIFPLSYAWHHFRHGYTNNPYEIEARAAEPGPDRRSP